MRKIVVVVLLSLALLITSCAPSPNLFVNIAADFPANHSPMGEVVLFKFTVSAQYADIVIKEMVFSWDGPEVKDLTLYDGGAKIMSINGYSHRGSKGKFIPWFDLLSRGGQPGLVIPKGYSKTFSIRGNVLTRGVIIFQLENLTLKKGGVVGLPIVGIPLYVGVK